MRREGGRETSGDEYLEFPGSVRCSRDDEPVGTNKRYPYLPAQRGEERELREVRKRGPLRTLDSLQLRRHAQPLTIVPEQVTIWVTPGSSPLPTTHYSRQAP